VTVTGAGGAHAVFEAAEGRSIVKAARAAGIVLTSGCLQGRCAICRGRLLRGKVGLIRRPSPNAVGSPLERADGCVLFCSVDARSDLVIEPLSPWHRAAR